MTRRVRRDPEAIAFARDQRARANEFARGVWEMVRDRGLCGQKFRREYPIPPYTADFCCVALKLIVEVDGESHQTAAGRHRDEARDAFLADQGYVVTRIAGYDVVRDAAAVRSHIEQAVERRLAMLSPPHPQPFSPAKPGEKGERFERYRTLAQGEKGE